MSNYVDELCAAGGTPIICYHGTNARAARKIIKNGFLTDTWFAPNLADAFAFGGRHIFSVVFDERFVPPKAWQWRITAHWPAERIVEYSVFHKERKFKRRRLSNKIFEAALAASDRSRDDE